VQKYVDVDDDLPEMALVVELLLIEWLPLGQ